MVSQSPDERKNTCRWISLAIAIFVLLLGIMFVRNKVPHKQGTENIAKVFQCEDA
jgi:hypothetical protein